MGADSGFPQVRMRRLRRTAPIRRLVRETTLSADDFVMPYFVVPGRGKRQPVKSMPGVFRLSVNRLVEEAQELVRLGVPGIILFGVPARKDGAGSEASVCAGMPN